jgi:nucleotide-binding universal stress UspA family protein
MTTGGPERQIVVATDFSDSADAALGVAERYARVLGARLHVLHVHTGRGPDATRLLADAAARVGPDVPVTVAGAGGDPAEEILRYARREPVELIVVGTHGRSGVSRLLLGSVAERVVRGARCPVLVVPMAAGKPAPAPVAPALSGAPLDEEVEAPRPPRPCLVCAVPTPDLICERCRARIRGEALEHKRCEERAGRS